MIFLFSGTGNSLMVAQLLSRQLGDKVVAITDGALPRPVDLAGEDRVVWCFPIYSWGVPPVVRLFIHNAELANADGLPHFMVATCGDDIGLAHEMWRRDAERRGYKTVAAHTVQMPNTYVTLPGFDVDPIDVALQKLQQTPRRVKEVAHAIKCCSPIDSVVKGHMAWLKTRIVYPLFMRFLTSPKPLHSTDSCIGCKKCVGVCPMRNVAFSEMTRRPEWGTDCAFCLACYHVCPRHAVAYGRLTRTKGQYQPDVIKSQSDI